MAALSMAWEEVKKQIEDRVPVGWSVDVSPAGPDLSVAETVADAVESLRERFPEGNVVFLEKSRYCPENGAPPRNVYRMPSGAFVDFGPKFDQEVDKNLPYILSTPEEKVMDAIRKEISALGKDHVDNEGVPFGNFQSWSKMTALLQGLREADHFVDSNVGFHGNQIERRKWAIDRLLKLMREELDIDPEHFTDFTRAKLGIGPDDPDAEQLLRGTLIREIDYTLSAGLPVAAASLPSGSCWPVAERHELAFRPYASSGEPPKKISVESRDCPAGTLAFAKLCIALAPDTWPGSQDDYVWQFVARAEEALERFKEEWEETAGFALPLIRQAKRDVFAKAQDIGEGMEIVSLGLEYPDGRASLCTGAPGDGDDGIVYVACPPEKTPDVKKTLSFWVKELSQELENGAAIVTVLDENDNEFFVEEAVDPENVLMNFEAEFSMRDTEKDEIGHSSGPRP